MILEDYGIIMVPAIAMICYLIGEAVKVTKINSDWVPIICGATGGLLGIAAMYSMIDFPAKDVITALAVGIFSGLSATGFDQLFKKIANLAMKK